MYFKKVIFCLSLIVIILSISSISASENIDVNESVECYSSQLSINEVSEIEHLSDYSESDVNSILLNSNNDDEIKDCEIFVGSNENDGDGSEENPYKTFDLACENVKDKNNVTINVFNGTYYLGSTLKFNCTNLHIKGIGENVIIKNQYNVAGKVKENGSKQAFSLTSLIGTFKISNIIFDSSEWTQSNNIVPNSDMRTNYYYIFYNYLGNNTVIVNDCKFKQSHRIVPSMVVSLNNVPYNIHNTTFNFNNCIFEYVKDKNQKNEFSWSSNAYVNLTYCIFKFTTTNEWGNDHFKIYNSWFGKNVLPNNVKGEINRYAIFSISEERINDNNYDIIGKLMWNDSSTDGIENFNPMTVTLNSETGEIPATATLENGTFKVRYTTNAKEHNITAKLDSEELKLAFNYNVDINVEANPINYGDDQNITINLPYNASGIIKLTFEDETSEEIQISELSSLNYTIKKALKVGTNNINVSLIDEDNHSYGSTVIYYTISKISDYTLDIDAPMNVTVGDSVEITVNLPEGATGNVTVKVGDNEAKTFDVDETMIIKGFVVGDNLVNVTYTGNDIYDAKSVVKTVVASVKPTALAAYDVVATYNVTKELVIILTSNGDALLGKTINVVVGTINKNLTTNASGQVSIDVSSLTPGNYTANIAFAGDEIYNMSSTTAKVTVKEEIKTDITIPEITAGKATITTITLPQNATGNVTVIVDGNITSVVNLTNGSVTVTIPELSAGKHNVTISYSGDNSYAGFAQTSAVEVKEPAKPTPKPDDQKPATVKKTATKITAKKKTFKAKTKVKKYTITLKAGKKAVKKVQVILKIGKKTYKAKTNAKGKATFKIKKLTKKGKYPAKITFKGNKLYKASSKKVKITIKK